MRGHGKCAIRDQRGAGRGQGRQRGPGGEGRHRLGGLGQWGCVAGGCRGHGTQSTLARLAGTLDHLVFVDGGDGPRRNVAALLLKKEVQFILVVCVHLIALAAVVELTGTEGVERPPAGGVQRAAAGCQGPQAAAG